MDNFELIWFHMLHADPIELLNAPSEIRDFVLRCAAERAAEFYENDPELTAFEAFGEDDFYDSIE